VKPLINYINNNLDEKTSVVTGVTVLAKLSNNDQVIGEIIQHGGI